VADTRCDAIRARLSAQGAIRAGLSRTTSRWSATIALRYSSRPHACPQCCGTTRSAAVRRVCGFPGVCSIEMTPSSFPRPGASDFPERFARSCRAISCFGVADQMSF